MFIPEALAILHRDIEGATQTIVQSADPWSFKFVVTFKNGEKAEGICYLPDDDGQPLEWELQDLDDCYYCSDPITPMDDYTFGLQKENAHAQCHIDAYPEDRFATDPR